MYFCLRCMVGGFYVYLPCSFALHLYKILRNFLFGGAVGVYIDTYTCGAMCIVVIVP